MKKKLKLLGLILALVLPIVGTAFIVFSSLNLPYDLTIYDLMWCGFYGCILLAIFCDSKPIKIILILANLMVIIPFAFVSLMGGTKGLFLVVVEMVIPFYFCF